MKQSKKIISVLIALSIIIVCFSPFQSFALSEQIAANNETIDTQNSQNNESDRDGIDENSDDQTTGSGIDLTTSGQAIDAEVTTGPAIKTTTDQAIEVKDDDNTENDESQWYLKQNPMKKEHQKLLWEYCKKRGLDYIDMLALIYTESNFDEKASTGKYFGYFQISKGNCADLATTLKTKNKPLDGAININWGTAMYSSILEDKRVKNADDSKKRDIALSIYQRGTGGYDKYGISTKFLKIYYKKRAIVSGWFDAKK